MGDQCVLLISMPWSSLYRPSIQLGTLQSVLKRSGFQVEARSFNLAFMDYLASCDTSLPNEQGFSTDDYFEVAERYYGVGLGDWIFAVAPFRNSKDSDEQYIDYLRDYFRDYFRDTDGWQEIFAKASTVRQLVPAFLERCVEDILAAAPAVVGFTTTFSQNVPSLVLAKLIKVRNPSLHIVFGGSNCDGPMGDALHRSFTWVDSVVRGEGERVLPELLHDIFSGSGIRPQPGLCYWQGERRMVVDQEGGADIPMDEVPLPDYDEYFELLDRSSSSEEILPNLSIPFESARGCWWGAKAHCTFCGLNGSSMAFRSKSAARVVEDLMALARKHRNLNFNAVDNIIAMPYFRELLPKLRDAGFDFSLFYETKSNLKKEQLWGMREAGVLQIQPGIESLSTPILRLMRKGVTALQNIRLLKWCAEFGIEPAWNVLYGFPGEPPAEFDRMAELMKSLTHLEPPRHLAPLDLQRFSPYHQRPREYGVVIKGPQRFYSLIYQCDEDALNDLAYTFNFSYDDGRQPESYITAIRESVDAWQSSFPTSVLSYRRGPGFLVINDRRPGFGGYDHTLGEIEAKVYLGCDGGATPAVVWRSLLAAGETEITLEDVKVFLDEMTESKLMYEEDGIYLSLAVDTNPQPKSVVVEFDDAVITSPALVKLARQGLDHSCDLNAGMKENHANQIKEGNELH